MGHRACRSHRSGGGARCGRRGARHHPASGDDHDRQPGLGPGRAVKAARARQLRARSERSRRHRRGDSLALGNGQDPGHQPGRSAGCRRTTLAGAGARYRTRIRFCGRDAVRRTRRSRGPRCSPGTRCRSRDLPPTGRHSAGNRAGRVANDFDDGDRGAGPTQRPLPPAGRIAPRIGTPPNTAPRGAVVLRPARLRRAEPPQPVLGLRGRIRFRWCVRGGRFRGRVRDNGLA